MDEKNVISGNNKKINKFGISSDGIKVCKGVFNPLTIIYVIFFTKGILVYTIYMVIVFKLMLFEDEEKNNKQLIYLSWKAAKRDQVCLFCIFFFVCFGSRYLLLSEGI